MSRHIWIALTPLAPLVNRPMAYRMSRNANLWLAKIVPDVTENWKEQDLHFHLRRVLMV